MKQNSEQKILLTLFVLVFIYALLTMTVAREFVIPSMATSSNGHLEGDPQYYNSLAIKKIQDIDSNGISSFELRPAGQGVAGVTSALFLIWNSPYIVVLINSILHALSYIIMVIILREWFPLKTALICALPLAMSPYMMFWFSQINKDTFSLIGSLLYTVGLLRLVMRKNSSLILKLFSVATAVVGNIIIWISRPYQNQMLVTITGAILIVVFIMKVKKHEKNREVAGFLMASLILIGCGAMLGKGAQSDQTLDSFSEFIYINHFPMLTSPDVPADVPADVSATCYKSLDNRNWIDQPLLPDILNIKLKSIAGQRCNILNILNFNNSATILRSFKERNRVFDGSLSVINYVPHAMLLGIFSPWPTDWLSVIYSPPSVFYTITSMEAGMMYVGLGGLIIWVYRGGNRSIFIPLMLSASMMTVYGLATPFLGALYRYRFPWWMLMICLGLAALIEVFKSNVKIR